MTVFAEYVREIRKNLERGDSTEHTHRPALKILLEACGKDIVATNEPRRIACGAPDFNITRKGVPLGHAEAKDVGANLDEMERGKGPNGEQFTRYRDGLPNWILTDYLQFRWFVNREKRLTVCLAELDAKGKAKPLRDGEEKLGQLLTAFFEQKALTVGTAKELAERMAGMTRIIRDLIVKAFEHEKEQGWLHNWLAAFRDTLIPELDEKQFADMFAQTLAYGLFAACVHTPANKEFSREMAAYNLPKTNPFLRKLFAEIAGVDMPDSIAWAVNDIVALLKHADMSEILKDFGKGRGKEDPVVHFYETFLAAYDPKMREVRGVYYTPEPVVSYIVRSIDHLLKTRFNRPKGLVDENTLILDPATGTATFLYFVIDQIHQKFAKQAGAWDCYVAQHLLNRIFGFELLMAPYAIAHLKIGMQLQETGYQFGSDQRLGIFLTNTLEEAAKKSDQLYANWISDEANAAAKIKRDNPILVVLGNPPYSGVSANRGEWITKLIEDYRVIDGKPLAEKKVWISDDYVKFLRFGQWRIQRTGQGILAFITNHGYLDNPTFRGMRQSLMNTFSDIYVFDLHGSSKKKQKPPTGGEDKNVFDIQQGVAITFFVKEIGKDGPARIHHAELWGTREAKYQQLGETAIATTSWKGIRPHSPYYFFIQRSERHGKEFESAWKVGDIFPANQSAIVTARDGLAIALDKKTLKQRIELFRDKTVDDATIETQLQLTENYAWRISAARKELMSVSDWESHFAKVLYRPFDIRHIYYHPAVVWRTRDGVMEHMRQNNLALATTRSVEIGHFEHVLCTREVMDHHAVSLKEVNYLFPLYLYATEKREKGEWGKAIIMALFEPSAAYSTRRANISPKFIQDLTQRLNLKWIAVDHGDLKRTVGPEDVFHYAYAVFHSPTYRTRYAEFLKIDFPRLPLTGDVKLFRALAAKGAELVALHLMESPKLEDFLTDWPVKGDNVVATVQYTDNDKRVWINKTQYFGGVPKAVWEFHIGGYQVCAKWLKDRKGRKLTYEDTQHYQKIVVALNETIRLMREIDEMIRQHGDWPTAFLGSNT
jgi:predicted helicase